MKMLDMEELVKRHLVSVDLYVLLRKARNEEVEETVQDVLRGIDTLKARYEVARSRNKKGSMTTTLASLMVVLDRFVPVVIIPYTNRLLHETSGS